MTVRTTLAVVLVSILGVTACGGDLEELDRIRFAEFAEDFAADPGATTLPDGTHATATTDEDGTTTARLTRRGQQGSCFAITVIWTVDWLFDDEPPRISDVETAETTECTPD